MFLVHDMSSQCAVKFLNFRTPKLFAVNYLKFKQKAKPWGISSKTCKWNRANSEDPEQAVPLGAV